MFPRLTQNHTEYYIELLIKRQFKSKNCLADFEAGTYNEKVLPTKDSYYVWKLDCRSGYRIEAREDSPQYGEVTVEVYETTPQFAIVRTGEDVEWVFSARLSSVR
jgi:hypothetical protein